MWEQDLPRKLLMLSPDAPQSCPTLTTTTSTKHRGNSLLKNLMNTPLPFSYTVSCPSRWGVMVKHEPGNKELRECLPHHFASQL